MTTVTFDYTPSYTDYVPLPTEPAEDYWDDDLDDVDEPQDDYQKSYQKGEIPPWMKIYYETLFLQKRRCRRRYYNSKKPKQDAPIPTD